MVTEIQQNCNNLKITEVWLIILIRPNVCDKSNRTLRGQKKLKIVKTFRERYYCGITTTPSWNL